MGSTVLYLHKDTFCHFLKTPSAAVSHSFLEGGTLQSSLVTGRQVPSLAASIFVCVCVCVCGSSTKVIIMLP